MAESGGVEEGGASVVVDGVGVGAAEGDERLEAVVVAAGRRAVQSGETVLRSNDNISKTSGKARTFALAQMSDKYEHFLTISEKKITLSVYFHPWKRVKGGLSNGSRSGGKIHENGC